MILNFLKRTTSSVFRPTTLRPFCSSSGSNEDVFDRLKAIAKDAGKDGQAKRVRDPNNTTPPPGPWTSRVTRPARDGYSSDEDGPVSMRRKLDRYLTDALGRDAARHVVKSAEFRSVFAIRRTDKAEHASGSNALSGYDFPFPADRGRAIDKRVAHLARRSQHPGNKRNERFERGAAAAFSKAISTGVEDRLSFASTGVNLAPSAQADRVSALFLKRENHRLLKHRNNCVFCQRGIVLPDVDYKNVPVLARFVSEMGRMMGRVRTGLCGKHSRRLAKIIKKSRNASLLPYMERPAGLTGRGSRRNDLGITIPKNYFALRGSGAIAAEGSSSTPGNSDRGRGRR